MTNHRFNSKLINLLAPVFNYLKDKGITHTFIESITNNPNTKYYISRVKDNNPQSFLNSPEYKTASRASGIQLVSQLDSEILNKAQYLFSLPNHNLYLVISSPEPENYPYYFDFQR